LNLPSLFCPCQSSLSAQGFLGDCVPLIAKDNCTRELNDHCDVAQFFIKSKVEETGFGVCNSISKKICSQDSIRLSDYVKVCTPVYVVVMNRLIGQLTNRADSIPF